MDLRVFASIYCPYAIQYSENSGHGQMLTEALETAYRDQATGAHISQIHGLGGYVWANELIKSAEEPHLTPPAASWEIHRTSTRERQRTHRWSLKPVRTGVQLPLRYTATSLYDPVEFDVERREPEWKFTRPETIYELRVSQIEGVAAIITWRREETIHLWTVIRNLDDEVANLVYEIEALLQQTFDQRFDFYVYAGDIEHLHELLPPTAQIKFLRSR